MERDRYLLLYDDEEQRRAGDLLGLENVDGPTNVIDVAELNAEEVSALDPKRVKASARAFTLEHFEWLEGGDVENAVVETDVGTTSWGVAAVGADRSQQVGRGVKVAVLDSGIDHTHSAFDGVDIVACDFTGESATTDESGRPTQRRQGPDAAPDENGHGTHCAATMVGRDVDGVRIGVAPGVTDVLAGKIHGESGLVSTDGLVEAIRWAVRMEADVISMSIGMNFTKQVERRIEHEGCNRKVATSMALKEYTDNVLYFTQLAQLLAAGDTFHQPVAVVIAAGNHSDRRAAPEVVLDMGPPAAARGFISVGAVGPFRGEGSSGPTGHKLSWFSNQGSTCVAPGVGIVSARLGGGLTTKSGTSMAAPHVAGLLALWIERLRAAGDDLDATPRAMNRLMANADTESLINGWTRQDYGEGLTNAPGT